MFSSRSDTKLTLRLEFNEKNFLLATIKSLNM